MIRMVPRVLLLLLLCQDLAWADPLANWTWRRPISPPLDLLGIAYAKGQFIAMGANGTILSSADGGEWLTRQSGTTNYLQAVAFGNDRFVAVGGSDTIWGLLPPAHNVIVTSPEGLAWQVRQAGIPYLTGITFGKGQFVAPGWGIDDAGSPFYGIFTSTDGVDWMPHKSAIGDSVALIWGLTYGNGLFVAVGGWHAFGPASGSKILTSTNGVNWVERSVETTNVIYDVAFGKGQFVAVTGHIADPLASNFLDYGSILNSSDGANWVVGVPRIDYGLRKVAFGNGQFVAMGDSGTISSSPDGLHWVPRTFGTDWGQGPSGLAYGNGHFVAVGYLGEGYRGGILQSGPMISLSIARNVEDGRFSLFLEGPTGAGYTIQTSGDLISWQNLTNFTLTEPASVILDALRATAGYQYYRAHSQ